MRGLSSFYSRALRLLLLQPRQPSAMRLRIASSARSPDAHTWAWSKVLSDANFTAAPVRNALGQIDDQGSTRVAHAQTVSQTRCRTIPRLAKVMYRCLYLSLRLSDFTARAPHFECSKAKIFFSRSTPSSAKPAQSTDHTAIQCASWSLAAYVKMRSLRYEQGRHFRVSLYIRCQRKE